jgi:hypothetical protein
LKKVSTEPPKIQVTAKFWHNVNSRATLDACAFVAHSECMWRVAIRCGVILPEARMKTFFLIFAYCNTNKRNT